MPTIKVRAAKEKGLKTVYDVLWSREIERVPHFGNWLPYTMPPGLPSATMLEEATHDGKHTRTTRHLPPGLKGP